MAHNPSEAIRFYMSKVNEDRVVHYTREANRVCLALRRAKEEGRNVIGVFETGHVSVWTSHSVQFELSVREEAILSHSDNSFFIVFLGFLNYVPTFCTLFCLV